MTSVSTALKPIADQWEWQFEGACNGADSESFFLEPNQRGDSKRTKENKAIALCNTCPVKKQCLEHALSVPEIYGVWGGINEENRAKLANSLGIVYSVVRI
jgi:WhiB family redox-sensing transcriptional regulator